VHKNRLEAFSDGVIAIILTIMVLELRPPEQTTLEALRPVIPVFVCYVLSFIFIGIYWNNHHHLLQIVEHVNGRVLWANLHLLFWLSLVPFVTRWMGEQITAAWPVALYGIVLFMSAIAYTLLSLSLIQLHGKNSTLAKAVGADLKGYLSLALYTIAVVAAFFFTWASFACYVTVAALWFIPDPRIEKRVKHNHRPSGETVAHTIDKDPNRHQ
jgi:uncharacterized membrane protein